MKLYHKNNSVLLYVKTFKMFSPKIDQFYLKLYQSIIKQFCKYNPKNMQIVLYEMF